MFRTDSTPAPSNQPEIDFHDYNEVKKFFGEELLSFVGLVHLRMQRSEDLSDLLRELPRVMGNIHRDPIKATTAVSAFLQYLISYLLTCAPGNAAYRKKLLTDLVQYDPLYGLTEGSRPLLSKVHVSEFPRAGENFLKELFKADELVQIGKCFEKVINLCGGDKTDAFKQFKADIGIDERTYFEALLKHGEKKFGNCETPGYKNFVTSSMIDAVVVGNEILFGLFLSAGKRAYGGNLSEFIVELHHQKILDKFSTPQSLPHFITFLENISAVCNGTRTDEFRKIFLSVPWFKLAIEKGDNILFGRLLRIAERTLTNAGVAERNEIFELLQKAKIRAHGENADKYMEFVAENLISKVDGESPLSPFLQAVNGGNIDIVRFLLMNFPERVRKALLRDKDPASGFSALHIACAKDHPEMTELLLKEGMMLWKGDRKAFFSFLDCKNSAERTPADTASFIKNQPALDLLVKYDPRLAPPAPHANKRARDAEDNMPPGPPPLEKPSLSSGKRSFPSFLPLPRREHSGSSHRSTSSGLQVVKREKSNTAQTPTSFGNFFHRPHSSLPNGDRQSAQQNRRSGGKNG